jgi:hypothetical protein
MLPEYHEVDGKMICDACGDTRAVGDWPICGGVAGNHNAKKHFGYDPLEPYVDEHLTTDPHGVEITTRGQRIKMMDQQALVYHRNKYINNGRVYFDRGAR